MFGLSDLFIVAMGSGIATLNINNIAYPKNDKRFLPLFALSVAKGAIYGVMFPYSMAWMFIDHANIKKHITPASTYFKELHEP